MLTFRVIACLDVRDGRVVKGVQFSNLLDLGDPGDRAGHYDAQGADEIVMLDVSATPEGRSTALDTVRAIRERIGIPLSVGGGVRSERDACALLEAGADKVCINSAAVENPEMIERLARRFGSQCVVVAIDTRPRQGGGYEVLVRSGTQTRRLNPIEWAQEAQARGAGEVLLTSWDRDGTGDGYDTKLLSRVAHAISIPLIASGGASESRHLAAAHHAGAQAALVASMLHHDRVSVETIKRDLRRANIEVRL